MFVLYDVDAADSAKSSTYERESPFGRSMWRDATYMTKSSGEIGEP